MSLTAPVLPAQSRPPRWLSRALGQLQHRPLLVYGWVAVLAVLLTDWLSYVPSPLFLLPCLLALGVGLFGQVRYRRWWYWLPFVALLFVVVHSQTLRRTYEHPLRQRLMALPGLAHPTVIKVRLYPWTDGAEWDATRAVADLLEVHLAGQRQIMRGRLKVTLPAGFYLEKAGIYEVSGMISLVRPPMNPGEFDAVSYNLRSGWVAWVQAGKVRLLDADAWAPRFYFLHWAETSRQWIMQALSLGIEERTEDKAVLMAMALGASDAAGEEIEEAFRNSGTLHIFAVSGLHVVMLATVLALGLRWLGVGRARSVWVLIVTVFVYAYITGWRPSAARAAFMIATWLVAVCWNRRADVHSNLGLAVLVLLLWDSNQLFMPGFQLSFLVLWAIALLAPLAMNRLRPWTELDPFLPPPLASARVNAECGARRWLAGLLCTSLAAWIGSLPLTLTHFHTVTPVGLLANLALVPMSGISIGVSCASLLCAAAGFRTGQFFCNGINARLARAMVACAVWFSSLPWASMVTDLRLESRAPIELQVFHLAAGSSSAHLRVEDQQWLIDSGNASSWRRVVRPFLRYRGINHLDGILLTHRDTAHVGAAPQVLQFGVPRLITSMYEPWKPDPGLTIFDELERIVPTTQTQWYRATPGVAIITGPKSSIQILYPGPGDRHDQADNRSLVFMLHLGTTRILWLGDAGFITEKRLLERGYDLRCDLLVHGCHENDPGGLTELLLAARPRAVISESRSLFAEKKPPARVHDYCMAAGIPHLELARTGGIEIRVTEEGMRLRPYRDGAQIHLPTRAW